MTETIEGAFEREMHDIYRRAVAEVNYRPSIFLGMLETRGALETARYLLRTPKVSDGFVALWEAKRPDLTVEHLVLRSPYRDLFTAEELETARARLGSFAPNEQDAPAPATAPQARAGTAEAPPPAVPTDVVAGDSLEQREAEGVLIANLSARISVPLTKKVLADSEGTRLEVDGYSQDPPVLVEAWAHQGPPKSAQKFKVLADAFKLLWIERAQLKRPARKILLMSDERAAAHFQGRSWMAAALRTFEIEVRVEPLPEDLRTKVEAAQKRQFR